MEQLAQHNQAVEDAERCHEPRGDARKSGNFFSDVATRRTGTRTTQGAIHSSYSKYLIRVPYTHVMRCLTTDSLAQARAAYPSKRNRQKLDDGR